MAFSIKAAFAHVSRGSVRLRGQDVPVRGLSAAETGLVASLLPPPAVPFGPDPDRGSKAPQIERPDTPAFRVEHAAWANRYNCAKLVISADMVGEDGVSWSSVKRDDQKPWITARVAELMGAMSVGEIAAAAEEIGRLSDPTSPDMLEAAEKVLVLTGDELERATANAPEWREPKRIALTYMGLLMSALSHHNVSIDEAEAMDPGVVAAMLASERLRLAEQRRVQAEMAAAAGVKAR